MLRSIAMMRPIALLAIVTLAACDQPLAPSAQSARLGTPVADKSPATTTSINQMVDVSGTMVSPCTGEPIVYQGSIHIVSAMTETADGIAMKYHMNTQNLSGVGQVTGAKYNMNQVMKEGADLVMASNQESGNVAMTYRIVSQGSLDNFSADVVYSFSMPTLQVSYTTQNMHCGG